MCIKEELEQCKYVRLKTSQICVMEINLDVLQSTGPWPIVSRNVTFHSDV